VTAAELKSWLLSHGWTNVREARVQDQDVVFAERPPRDRGRNGVRRPTSVAYFCAGPGQPWVMRTRK
jgi:hypothetical protein